MTNNIKHQIEEMRDLSGSDIKKCMKCGRCSAACPSYDEMDIRPHQFVSYLARGDVQELLQAESLWRCLGCFNCVQRCPRGVAPANLIEAARLMVIRKQGGEHISPEEVAKNFDEDMPQQLLVAAFRKFS